MLTKTGSSSISVCCSVNVNRTIDTVCGFSRVIGNATDFPGASSNTVDGQILGSPCTITNTPATGLSSPSSSSGIIGISAIASGSLVFTGSGSLTIDGFPCTDGAVSGIAVGSVDVPPVDSATANVASFEIYGSTCSCSGTS